MIAERYREPSWRSIISFDLSFPPLKIEGKHNIVHKKSIDDDDDLYIRGH